MSDRLCRCRHPENKHADAWPDRPCVACPCPEFRALEPEPPRRAMRDVWNELLEEKVTNPDLDTIAHLDWHGVTCQCGEHEGGCPNQALYVVAKHALYRCDEPGLNNGNIIELRCGGCLAKLIADIHYKLDNLNRFVGGHNQFHCRCGEPIAGLNDILRSVQLFRPVTPQ